MYLHFHIPNELHAKLQELAVESDRSVSAQVRSIIKKAYQEHQHAATSFIIPMETSILSDSADQQAPPTP